VGVIEERDLALICQDPRRLAANQSFFSACSNTLSTWTTMIGEYTAGYALCKALVAPVTVTNLVKLV
jgi:hypothetical protein